MRGLTDTETSAVLGGGALGNALGMVVGGLVTAVAAMAATGGTALAAVGVVGAGARVGGQIGSAIEDLITG